MFGLSRTAPPARSEHDQPLLARDDDDDDDDGRPQEGDSSLFSVDDDDDEDDTPLGEQRARFEQLRLPPAPLRSTMASREAGTRRSCLPHLRD
jgi:hypothetical protein